MSEERGQRGTSCSVLVVLGTRPEVIKLAPVVRSLEAAGGFEVQVLSTGQHRELVDTTCAAVGLQVHHDLGLMQDRQGLGELFAGVLNGTTERIRSLRPKCVVVQGDTSTTTAAALAAFYEGVPVAHVEAGLRSGVVDDPFPEEANRRMVSVLATWHFAPTDVAARNLLAECISSDRIEVTGNTSIDSLKWVLGTGTGSSAFVGKGPKVLVTLHRRENQSSLIPAAAAELRLLADRGFEVVLPLHPSPAVRDAVVPRLSGSHVRLTEPLDYPDFVRTLADAHVVVTDSGGVQEEAPYLGVPVLVARRTTERSEAVVAGAATLLGDDMAGLAELASNAVASGGSSEDACLFGAGDAAERIANRLKRDLVNPELRERAA